MCKICSLTDSSYSPTSSERCARSLNMKFRPEFCHKCSIFNFSFFFTLQLKMPIFFQCLHWRLFCSTLPHRCLGFVPDKWLMPFILNNTLLGCSWREGEKKSSFCGMKGHCWQLVRSVGERTGFVNPWARQSPQCESVAPHMCLCICQGGGCTA